MMARKFGKKNIVKVNPLAYNLALMGESGIGKTTLAYELQKKLAGEDGYLHLNVGLEDGISALQGIVYEDVPNWTAFEEVIDDIVENKDEDYKELKMITIDTVDELEIIAKKEVIRQHNLKSPKDRTDSFNKAFGGFNRPHEKLEELILGNIQKLREIGVSVFLIGHVKKKTKSDPLTESEYDIITAKMSARLFTSLQTKMHVLGLAVIDRSIQEEIIGKDYVGKDKKVGKIKAEKRVIKFRDDNFAVESKSRFAKIVSEVEFSTDNFIGAITDAIHAEFENEGELKKAKTQQDKEFKEKTQGKIDEIKEEKNLKEKYGAKSDLIESIKHFYLEKASKEQKSDIKDKLTELNISKFDQLEDNTYEEIEVILNLTK
jgi:hypothetical protein